MSYWRGLRWSTAWIFLPLIAAAAYAAAISEREFFGDYRLVATSQAWVALVVVAPLLAGWAAWDAASLRSWLDVAMGGEHRGKALARTVAPALGLTMTVVAGVVLVVAGWPSDLTSWAVPAGAGATMLAAGALGAALGMNAPRIVAAPIGVLGTYAVMALVVADPSRWMGRAVLVGVVAPCCASTEQVNTRSLVTVVATCAVLGAGSVLVACRPLTRGARTVSLPVPLGLAVLVAWVLTLGSGSGGQLVARTSPTSCQPADQHRVCLWPEHAGDHPQVHLYVQRAAATARALGLRLPSLWTEKPAPHAMTFQWTSDVTEPDHWYALGLDIAHRAGCTSAEDQVPVAAYLALRMGAPAPEIMVRAADAADVAVRAARLSEVAQQTWFQGRIGQCQR